MPYSDDAVFSAVSEIRIVIEVCDGRFEDWEAADDFTKLADHGLNFALVVGVASAHPASLDYERLAVRTLVDGKVIKEGVGTHAVGNPLRLLPWLANHARARGGLSAGTIVTMGAWLGLHVVQPGAEVTVNFPRSAARRSLSAMREVKSERACCSGPGKRRLHGASETVIGRIGFASHTPTRIPVGATPARFRYCR